MATRTVNRLGSGDPFLAQYFDDLGYSRPFAPICSPLSVVSYDPEG